MGAQKHYTKFRWGRAPCWLTKTWFYGNQFPQSVIYVCVCVPLKQALQLSGVSLHQCSLRDPEQAEYFLWHKYEVIKYKMNRWRTWWNHSLKTVRRCSSRLVLLLPCFTNDADMLKQKKHWWVLHHIIDLIYLSRFFIHLKYLHLDL